MTTLLTGAPFLGVTPVSMASDVGFLALAAEFLTAAVDVVVVAVAATTAAAAVAVAADAGAEEAEPPAVLGPEPTSWPVSCLAGPAVDEAAAAGHDAKSDVC